MDIEIKKTVNNREILDSGSFLSRSDSDNLVRIKKGKEIIIFNLQFENTEDKKIGINIEVQSGGEIIPEGKKIKSDELKFNIKLRNFVNSLGTGFSELFNIANFDNGDKIYLDLWVRPFGNSPATKEIIYSIYLEKNG